MVALSSWWVPTQARLSQYLSKQKAVRHCCGRPRGKVAIIAKSIYCIVTLTAQRFSFSLFLFHEATIKTEGEKGGEKTWDNKLVTGPYGESSKWNVIIIVVYSSGSSTEMSICSTRTYFAVRTCRRPVLQVFAQTSFAMKGLVHWLLTQRYMYTSYRGMLRRIQ